MTLLIGGATASASVRAARIFTDHMVLQREAPVPVWGEAKPGTDVVVDFAGQSARTTTNGKGRWRITLRPMKANATGREMTLRTNEDRNVIRDVLVGEVWFAGGQSNMEFSAGQMARRLAEGKALVDGANFGAIRFRKVNERDSPTPTQDLSARSAWAVCSPKTVGRYSAVAFVFARRIHRELGVPVGVIDCSWGGTPIESYVPAEAFVGHPTLEKLAALARAGDVEGIKAMRGGTF
ncbi:MAG: sialate O-acetylesterase, partial [Phycisphaerae bacterium]|nr:sialate O-acetylesterase [Phycisphaerae bacterium]